MVLKTSFDKNKPCQILYSDYKNFNSESFNEDLQNILSTTQINTKQFKDTFLSVFNMHAPLKKKSLRADHSQYVTKALKKAVIRGSTIEKINFKKQTNESLEAYKKQENYCSKLYKKEQKKFFDILNTSVVSNNKAFLKVIKSLSTYKSTFGRNTKLIEKEEILNDYAKIAEELTLFFSNAAKSLNIAENTYITESLII